MDLAPLTDDELARLKPGDEVLVRATIISPVAGSGDVQVRIRKDTTCSISQIEGRAPPMEFKVGDWVHTSTSLAPRRIEAIANGHAFLTVGPFVETSLLHLLTRAHTLRGARDGYDKLWGTPPKTVRDFWADPLADWVSDDGANWRIK